MAYHTPPPGSAVWTDVHDQTLTLTLADHTNHNTLTTAAIGDLLHGLERAAREPDIRVVVLTNTGSVFCAGADLRSADRAIEVAIGPQGFTSLLHAIPASPVPVIGRIDGHAVGGGLGLAAACDISIAPADVEFGFPEVRIGAIPAVVASVCLPKMRRGDALEAFLRGNRFSASRAAEIGLLTRAVRREDLDDTVSELVSDLKRGGPLALAGAKRLVCGTDQSPGGFTAERLAAMSAEFFDSDERREGVAAFLSKRPASWIATGK